MGSLPYTSSASQTARAARSTTKSWLTQRREMLQLYTRAMIPPGSYRLYRFYERDKDVDYMLNFLSAYAQRNMMQRRLNAPQWKVVLDNKWLFHLHCRQFGLPTPRTYGVYDPQSGVTAEGEPLRAPEQLRALLEQHRPTALVVKPLGGIMGKQVLVLKSLTYTDGDIRAVTNTGERMRFDDLTALLDRPPDVRFYNAGYKLELPGYLIQEKLQQHQFLSQLAPYTTNTIRVATFLDRDSRVHLLGTVVRLGRRGTMADNWDRGGIAVAIDPVTGCLGQGVVKPKYGLAWLEEHPDSGVRFTGSTMPFWPEVLELCRRAAEVTPNVRSIGWDIALTADGPVLIEGNPDWDLALVQVHTRGILQPALRAELARFGLSFPQHTLPPFSAADWWTRLREQYQAIAFEHPDKSPLLKLIHNYLGEVKHALLD